MESYDAQIQAKQSELASHDEAIVRLNERYVLTSADWLTDYFESQTLMLLKDNFKGESISNDYLKRAKTQIAELSTRAQAEFTQVLLADGFDISAVDKILMDAIFDYYKILAEATIISNREFKSFTSNPTELPPALASILDSMQDFKKRSITVKADIEQLKIAQRIYNIESRWKNL